ncbi:sensor histidine kinase [Paenibacillus sp. NPDC058071]|uniref:sensor histidine kinase n=1 Tax=Paenibacillus sp. NPDC058071 TaxID=3346326 RepID=UPI0036DCC6A7
MKAKLHNRLSGKITIRIEMLAAFIGSLLLASVISLFGVRLLLRTELSDSVRHLAPFLFVAVFIVSYFLFTRRVVRYLITLADGLHVISEGDLNYRVPQQRADELGRVARGINAMTEKLQQQMQRERELERTKMELITSVSHDLRTPLTSMIGYLELLRTKSYRDEEEYERFIENTYNKAIYLKKLIHDLFEYTRLASNDVQLHLQPTDVRGLLGQLLFEFEPFAEEHDASLAANLTESPVLADVDSEKLVRVIENLLINALNYSIKPGIIRVSLHTDDHNAYIAVENKGMPITKEQESKLFDRFYKIDDSRKNDEIQSGTGLGLSISRNIMELHGGILMLWHEEGLFRFTASLSLSKAPKSSS